jgi:hypothetical protein
MTVETREVLAGVYVIRRTMLTHSVELDDDGIERKVLCRVRLGSLADAGSLDVGGRHARPTCPVCLRRDPRFKL